MREEVVRLEHHAALGRSVAICFFVTGRPEVDLDVTDANDTRVGHVQRVERPEDRRLAGA